MNKKTPIAVFAYKRARHLRQLFESLLKCHRLGECQIFIYCDGSKRPEDEAQIQAARQIAQNYAPRLKAQVITRDQNLGLAHSIVAGVTNLCEQYGRVIVLEDDLVVHPTFAHFMLSALDRYQDEDRVAQISGYMFPVWHADIPDAFFLPYTTSWGWAVWDRAWRLFDWQPNISSLDNPHVQYRFNRNGVTNHVAMLQEWIAGLNQSWDVLYYWAVFSAEKYVLFPKVSLVQNNGFDGSGVHYATKQSIANRSLLTYERWLSDRLTHKAAWLETRKFTWPDNIEIDEAASSRISAYRRARAAGLISYSKSELSEFWRTVGWHE